MAKTTHSNNLVNIKIVADLVKMVCPLLLPVNGYARGQQVCRGNNCWKPYP